MQERLADLPPQRTDPAEPPDREDGARSPSGALVPLSPAELTRVGPAEAAIEIGQAEIYRSPAQYEAQLTLTPREAA